MIKKFAGITQILLPSAWCCTELQFTMDTVAAVSGSLEGLYQRQHITKQLTEAAFLDYK